MSPDPVVIACDESGSEGENVTSAGHRVFVHASIAVGESEAAELMAQVRRLAPSQAPEYKADQILRPTAAAAASWLLAPDGPLTGRARVYLVEKDDFVVGKAVDRGNTVEFSFEQLEPLFGLVIGHTSALAKAYSVDVTDFEHQEADRDGWVVVHLRQHLEVQKRILGETA